MDVQNLYECVERDRFGIATANCYDAVGDGYNKKTEYFVVYGNEHNTNDAVFDDIILLELDCVTNPIRVIGNAFNSTYTFYIGVSKYLEIQFPTYYFKSSCDVDPSNPTLIEISYGRSNDTVIGVDCGSYPLTSCTSDSKFNVSLTAVSDV